MLTYKDMCDYGYSWKDMMPITEEEAIEMDKKFQVYVLYPDGTDDAICSNIKNYLGKGYIFGVHVHETESKTEKMLCVSTAHIKQSTAKYLEEGCKNDSKTDLILYEKKVNYPNRSYTYGWFVYCGYDLSVLENVPKDLLIVMEYAKHSGHEWIMFDSEEDEHPLLKKYEWRD